MSEVSTTKWIKGPNAPDKLCVAQVGGWIVTTWGEASLLDWIQRYQKKSTDPSLAQNNDYKKSLTRVGKGSMTLFYLNQHALVTALLPELAKLDPAQSADFAKHLNSTSSVTIGTRFENGEIVDRLSI